MTDITGSTTTTTPRHEFTLEPDTMPYSHLLACSWSLPDNEWNALQQALAASEHFLTCTATERGSRYRLVFNEHADPAEVINFISETVEEVLGATWLDPDQKISTIAETLAVGPSKQFKLVQDGDTRLYAYFGWRLTDREWQKLRTQFLRIQAVNTVMLDRKGTEIDIRLFGHFDITSAIRLIRQIFVEETGGLEAKEDFKFPADITEVPIPGSATAAVKPIAVIPSTQPSFVLVFQDSVYNTLYLTTNTLVANETFGTAIARIERSPATRQVTVVREGYALKIVFSDAFDANAFRRFVAEEWKQLTQQTHVEGRVTFEPTPVGPDLPES